MTYSGMVRIVRVLAVAMVNVLHDSVRSYLPPPPLVSTLKYKYNTSRGASDCAHNHHCSSLYKGMKSTLYFELVHTNIDKRQTWHTVGWVMIARIKRLQIVSFFLEVAINRFAKCP